MSDIGLRNVTTPRLGLNQPDVGGDIDVWGDLLNGNATILDQALLVGQAAAAYLALAGGTMSGQVLNQSGTAGAPSFATAASAGMYPVGANVGISAFGTQVFTFGLAANISFVTLNMNNNRITGLAMPTTVSDAVNVQYLQNYPALLTTGGTMTGPLTLAADGAAAMQPVTVQQFNAIAALMAPLASPAFTGTPTAPTAAPGTNTTQLATTAFVDAAIAGSVAGVSSFNTRTGAVTLTLADVTGAGGAPLASPGLTGTPTAPTASPGTNTTQLATTAFVRAGLGAYLPLAGGSLTGSLGVGMTPPADAAAGTLFAGLGSGVSWAINTYSDASSNWRRNSATACPATITSDAGGVRVNVAAPGALDSIATGFISGLRVDQSGSAYVAGNLSVGATNNTLLVGSSGSFFLTDNGTYRYLGFQQSYALQFRISDGALIYQTPTAPALTVSAGGAVSAFAQLSAPQVSVTGGTFANYPSIYWSGGAALMAYNGSFYWTWNSSSGNLIWQTATNSVQFRADNTFWISGQGYKPGGGTWADSSDARVKRDVEDYAAGLAQVMQLRPVTYRYNGHGGTVDDGARHHGLIAQEARPVMPEMVGSQRGRLSADDAEETDILTLNATPLIYALVNAVHTLSDRLTTLEDAWTR